MRDRNIENEPQALRETSSSACSLSGNRRLRKIDLEVHFAIPEYMDEVVRLTHGLYSNYDLDLWRLLTSPPPGVWTPHLPRFFEMDEARIAEMDRAGIDMGLLSLVSPGVQIFEADLAADLAVLANDRLAEAIGRFPDRFGGLAAFAPQDPKRAVKEIERAIGKLKLNGLLVNSHTNGEYLDDRKFWPILEAAEALHAPIYLHPRGVPDAMAPALGPDFTIKGAMWGYGMETGLHAMRLIRYGVFDRFPNLKIVLGHLGEGLPYWYYRMDHWHCGETKSPGDCLKQNFMVTTSGMNHHPVLEYCCKVLGPENILFASDYPFQEMTEAAAFIESSTLPDADLLKIGSENARRLFRLERAWPKARGN